MMSLTFGLFTQVSDSGPQGRLVYKSYFLSTAILDNDVLLGILFNGTMEINISVNFTVCILSVY